MAAKPEYDPRWGEVKVDELDRQTVGLVSRRGDVYAEDAKIAFCNALGLQMTSAMKRKMRRIVPGSDTRSSNISVAGWRTKSGAKTKTVPKAVPKQQSSEATKKRKSTTETETVRTIVSYEQSSKVDKKLKEVLDGE